MDKWVIMTGNPGDGFTLYGIFDSHEKANEFALNNVWTESWWIMEIENAFNL